MFTFVNLKQMLPTNRDPAMWTGLLQTYLPKYNIDTNERVAAFLSQTGHESSDFNVLLENMNYSAQGLLAVFPRYFTAQTAAQYARNPEAIGNIVYANRMGNGTDDGYKYRGRGLIQITGKNAYYQCSQNLFSDDRLLDNPDLLLQPEYALQSACWFWSINNLNAVADSGSVLAMTKRINGGTNGLDDRTARYNKVLNLLS